MAKEFGARLEDAQGRVVGPDPAWTPSRQFLWDVVHDTRGLVREQAYGDDVAVIRTIDAKGGNGGPGLQLAPARVRAAYARILDRARAAGEEAPRFRLVSPAEADEWSAVQFFEEAGAEYALVGGWTGPILRTITPEPGQEFFTNVESVTVGGRSFRVRSVPFAEYFASDFDSLFAVLDTAERERLLVRFIQR